MKPNPTTELPSPASTSPAPVSRRTVFVGAGTAGALAAAANLLKPPAVEELPMTNARAEAPLAEGYRLSEHVKRYYKTARV